MASAVLTNMIGVLTLAIIVIWADPMEDNQNALLNEIVLAAMSQLFTKSLIDRRPLGEEKSYGRTILTALINK